MTTLLVFLFLFVFHFMFTGVLPTCVSLYHMHIVALKAREGVGSPGTDVTVGYKLPHTCWNLNLGPFKEQEVLIATKSLSSVLSTLPSWGTHYMHIVNLKKRNLEKKITGSGGTHL